MGYLLLCVGATLAAPAFAGEVGPTSQAQMTIRLHLTPRVQVSEVEGRDDPGFEVCMGDADFVGRIVASTRVVIPDDCGTSLVVEASAPRDNQTATLTIVPE